MTSTQPSEQPKPDGPMEIAVGVGAQAVAEFADEHHIKIAPELREDLARAVLTAASTYLATPTTRGQT
ncbi:hypothetical protein K1W54_25290 [Micromonospora sp. CPCC 205371]|nr:hypothetical protein [Micromonospora sp. CPCC 205371]